MSIDKSQAKILVVNDRLELRTIIRDFLRNEGYTNLSFSENGLSALKKAELEPPDLIVADANCPGLPGLELLQAIRRNPTLADTPFVIISSEAEQRYVAMAAEKRVSGFILKPFSQKILIEKVDRLLEYRLNPDELFIHYHDANRLAQEGDLSGALEKYYLALDATQRSMAALYYKIGRVHESLSEDNQAESNYQEAVGLSDLFVDAFDALGTLNLRRNQADDALVYLKKSSKISPLNADRQQFLGEALLETGHFSDAEQAFKTALELDPSKTHVFNRLGISLRRQGKLEEASQYFHQALEVSADDENLLYNLSRLYLDRGDKEKAVEFLFKALELNPDFKEARDLLAEIQME